MTVYGPRKFLDPSCIRLAIWVAASAAVHVIVMWISGLTASNFQGRFTPLHVELRTAIVESREPLAISGPSADLGYVPQGQDRAPAPSDNDSSIPRQLTDRPDTQSLPLNIYYSSSEVDTRAEPLNDVDLVYPLTPYQQRVRGVVRINIFVNERGGIDKVVLVEAKPPGIFDEEALRAVGELKFSPAIKNGLPVKNRKTIEVTFDPYERINSP